MSQADLWRDRQILFLCNFYKKANFTYTQFAQFLNFILFHETFLQLLMLDLLSYYTIFATDLGHPMCLLHQKFQYKFNSKFILQKRFCAIYFSKLLRTAQKLKRFF